MMRSACLLLPLLAGTARSEGPELRLVGSPAGHFSLTVGGVTFAEAAPLTVQCEGTYRSRWTRAPRDA